MAEGSFQGAIPLGKDVRGMKKNLYILLSFLFILVIAAAIISRIWISKGPSSQDSQAKALFESNCAICHNTTGDGKGEAAFLLYPKPRNFRAGKFRLVTSQNLQPTREDLFRTISNGMPGTAMPSFVENISPGSIWSLVKKIRELSNSDEEFGKTN